MVTRGFFFALKVKEHQTLKVLPPSGFFYGRTSASPGSTSVDKRKPHRRQQPMAIDPKQLDDEANAELEKLMNPAPVEQDKPEPQPTDTADEPVAQTGAEQPPAPKETDKGFNVEESYKNLRAEYTRKAQENAELKRQLDQVQQQLNQSSQSQPTPKAEPEPEPDGLDAAANDFEELSPLVKKVREQEAKAREQEAIIRDLKARQEKQTQDEYYGRIAAKHPDHVEVFQSPEFKGWMSRLNGMDARAAQIAFAEGSPEDVIEVFDRYKKSAGMGKAEQAAQLAEPTLRSRSQPQTQSPRGRFTWQQIEKMSAAEFTKNEEAINQAITNGEVI